ncbi:MAG TPA: hypothetical protein VLE02_01340 [Nitrosarchaeum sp.]|nr:hypothetical protein [Nitrosarchaeum sp.]
MSHTLKRKKLLSLEEYVKEFNYPFDPLKVNPLLDCDDTFLEKNASLNCWRMCRYNLVQYMRLSKIYNDYIVNYKKCKENVDDMCLGCTADAGITSKCWECDQKIWYCLNCECKYILRGKLVCKDCLQKSFTI